MVWRSTSVNADLDVVMEILKKHSSKSRPLCTREIKELSNYRLVGHGNLITPMLTYQAEIGKVVRLDFLNQRDGYRYYVAE